MNRGNSNRRGRGRGGNRNSRNRASVTTGGKSVSMTLLKSVPIFPIHKLITGQVYYDYGKILTGSTGSVPTQFFSANGIFDTDISGIGHQPIGFDQMMLMYEHYTVLRAHLKVSFASAGDHARVGVYLNPDTTTQSAQKLVENGLVKLGLVAGPPTSNGHFAFSTLELVCDIPKYFGRTRAEIIADPDMRGTVVANPDEQVYFGIAAWAAFDSVSDVSVGFDVTLTFETLYWEPRKLAPS